jgi:hypothetical protein
MRKVAVASIWVASVLWASACSRKAQVPAEFSAVPADADIVGTMDAKALLDYLKEALPRLVPPEMKDKIPSIQSLVEQALKVSGVDISQLKNVVFIGYAGSGDKMALLAEGVKLGKLEGSTEEDYQGVKVQSLPQASSYLAQFKTNWLVMAPSSDMVKKVLDTATGRQKPLADGERASLLKELAGQNADLNQVRIYLLSGNLPGTPPEVKMRGASLLLHLEKGVSGNLLSDEKSAMDLKNKLDMGLMAARLAFSMPQKQSGMQISLDEESQKAIGEVLNKLESKVQGGTLSVNYRGSLKPLIEKAVAMGIKNWNSLSAVEMEKEKEGADQDDEEKDDE